MQRSARLIALAGCLALLLTAACNGDEPQATEEPTIEPSPTASVESIGEFQLVALIEQAFLSIEPGIDLPSDVTQPGEQGEEQAMAGVSGVMRGEVEAFSDNLRDRCGADDGDRFNLFWTEGTLFDESLLDRSLELELDGRRVGVIGTVFMRGEDGTGTGEDLDLGEESPGTTTASPGTTTAPPATTTPQASPGVTTAEGEDDCILVVQEVGISGGALPTRRPAARTTPTRPAATRTPTPTAVRTPTPSPTRSPSPPPTETPEDTPTESPEPDDSGDRR